MREVQIFKFGLSTLIFPLFFTLTLWLVYWFEIKFHTDLSYLGIYPRTLSGLKGVVLSPFLHGSIGHLYNNSIPVFVLLTILLSFYRKQALKVVFAGILLSGLITWCIGRSSYHIGASGLIYVLTGFIFFKGILARHFRLIALSLLIIFVYGGLVWYLFPVDEQISWEGHLGGFISGLVLAVLLKKDIPEPPKYHWEQDSYDENTDPFLKHFDEHGNFIPTSEILKEQEHLKDEKSETEL